MLRLLVAALLLANLLFFGWSRGWLDGVVGVPAQGDREPQRLASQVRPELVTLLPPATAGPGSGSGSGSGSAPEAGSAPAYVPASAAGPAPAASAATPAASQGSAAAVAASAKASAAAAAASDPPKLALAPASGPVAAAASAAATAASSVCLEAGPFAAAELAAAEGVLRSALPAGSWAERKANGGEWMIYMGPYPDRDWLERKKSELARIRGGVPQEEITAPPELARGLSLGRFSSQAAANTTLAQYRSRGIRTARVLRSGNGPALSYLRIAQADSSLAGQAAALKLPAPGKAFTACAKAP